MGAVEFQEGPIPHFFRECTGEPGFTLHYLCLLEPGHHVCHVTVADPRIVVQEDPDMGQALQLGQGTIVKDFEGVVLQVEAF